MDLIKDISDILVNHGDVEHNVKISIDSLKIEVDLEYDPDFNYDSNMIIPIVYDFCNEMCYIPDDKYREMYRENTVGIDLPEIIIIKDIMEYLQEHGRELENMSDFLDGESRYNKSHKKPIPCYNDSISDSDKLDF